MKTLDADCEFALQDELTEIIRAQDGRSEQSAAALACKILDALRGRYAGADVYIPKGADQRAKKRRNDAIRAEYNGRNLLAVCAKYQIGRTRLYQIVGGKKSTFPLKSGL